MGFGFNLLMVFVILPLTMLLLLMWLISKKRIIGKVLFVMSAGIFGLVFLATLMNLLTSKKVLDKNDYYGEYTIDRNYFSGKQADWQYNHFRFEITENDSIFFYVTDKEDVIETYKGTIDVSYRYKSAVLVIDMEQETHHILTSNPTIYREAWGFFLVFQSPKFYNTYFRKNAWESIE